MTNVTNRSRPRASYAKVNWVTEFAHADTGRTVRYAERIVIALTVILALVEFDRINVIYGAPDTIVAGLATAIYLPLHVWHLRYGLRGERPPQSGVTLAVIAVVQIAALAYIGPGWSFVLATLATSSLIVLRPRWAFAAFVLCVLLPLPAVLWKPGYTTTFDTNFEYLMVAVAFRACLQFTLVWLVASAREIGASRELMATEAAEREHDRLEAAMRTVLERSLVRLAAEARRARAEVLEPGVAAALVALDRVLSTATEATDELRQLVAQARAARAAGSAADAAIQLAGVEARSRTPIGRGLTVRGAWQAFVAVHLTVLGFVLAAGLGAFRGTHAGLATVPAWVALTVIQVWMLLAVARGERPRFAYAWFAVVAATCAGMMFGLGTGWRDPGWYVGVAAAVAFRGRARVVAVSALLLLTGGAYEIWRVLQVLPSAGFLELSWDSSYTIALIALGVIGLYGSARLIRSLGELDLAREAQVRYAVEAERRRIWGDVHDVLGQTLTAITLKADLARRTIAASPERSLIELDEVIDLAAGQAHGLGVIARGETEVTFEAEIETAVALLRAAGIDVQVDLSADELDPAASGLLGWVVREGTTNILRHASARQVWIRAGREDGRVVFELRNDGARHDGLVSEAGSGLRGIAERASSEGGLARGHGVSGGQFVLRVSVPERVAV
jgi:two-component system sensor histidine kinase DesK